jgi:hypothetical protein
VTATTDRVIDLVVDAGLVAERAGVLPDALAELIVRADITAGDLLAALTASCFGRHADGVCPVCGHSLKQDPGNPHPKPPPPPPPPPKPGK